MRRLTVVLILALISWAPCASHGFAATQSADANAETSNAQRQKIQKQFEKKLSELDREINELKAKAPKNEEQLNEQFRHQMADLQKKRDMARKKLDKLRVSAERAWQDMEPGVDAAIKDLDAAYQRAAADFKNTK